MRAMSPFTGTWQFRANLSELSAETPRSWTQQIAATSDELNVREEIVRSDGSPIVSTARAMFDGHEYPVSGSSAAGTMAYTRVDIHRISGTGRKNAHHLAKKDRNRRS